jgi:hypothetical protein
MPTRGALAFCAMIMVLGLGGCVSPEDLRRQDEAQCRSYGFTPATPDFATCLQRESLARRYPPPYWAPPLWAPYPGPFGWR